MEAGPNLGVAVIFEKGKVQVFCSYRRWDILQHEGLFAGSRFWALHMHICSSKDDDGHAAEDEDDEEDDDENDDNDDSARCCTVIDDDDRRALLHPHDDDDDDVAGPPKLRVRYATLDFLFLPPLFQRAFAYAYFLASGGVCSMIAKKYNDESQYFDQAH